MVRIGTEEIISTRLDDRLSFADEAETGSRHLILEVQYTDQQHLHQVDSVIGEIPGLYSAHDPLPLTRHFFCYYPIVITLGNICC